MTTEKVIIIGGGPTGIAASIYNARANLHPLVIAGSPAGGQLMLTSHVENYPGFSSILGPELMKKMREHAVQFDVRFIDENVSHIDVTREPFQIFLRDGKTSYLSESILIATGADALWLNLQSEQRLRGKGVSACATCDAFFFKNKIVGVVGGGDTAMEEALTLTQCASKVYVIHRKSEFRASKIMQRRVLEHPKIEVIWNTTIEEVLGEKKVEGVRLESKVNPAIAGQKLKVLVLDGLFVAIGHKPASDFLKGSGVMLDEKGYVMTSGMYALKQVKSQLIKLINNNENFDFNYQYMTSVRGVFSAGDVIDPYYRQAATAVGMGVAASLEIEKYISHK
ncbi:MAG TPA: FAD-dependent oxidoreductase [Patescibacteria group bacterium]|nr:FAD-dependent oxidoreductase [Patescibacteria group bacterium]